VAVVIPARDEDRTIGACIRAVLRACDAAAGVDRAWVVVAADRCTDDTVRLARRALRGRGEVFECDWGSVGAARRSGVEFALAELRGVDPRRLWIANTDADTIVGKDWIDVHLGFAQQNFAAVAGIARIEGVPGYGTDMVEALSATYEIPPDGRHSHVHGANLGVRADAYLDVGGWSRARLAEDHCLWNRLRSGGWRVCASSASSVVTSGRLEGRAAGGFADTLRSRVEALLAGS
jgi:cellulose synthase/poly-beta-1,6-N-acetylglucosamine synthase-like glycosyltransferase